jgi:mono/diheme cytochrome c family protein
MWALPVVAFLPLWGFLYATALSPPATTAPTQLDLGAEIYAGNGCGGCHGAGGGGGTGRPLSEGEVLATFPTIDSMLEFVALGSDGHGLGDVYGDPDREGGAHVAGDYVGGALMPGFADSLTPDELLAVVRHERETLAGEEIPADQLGPEGELLHPNGTPYLTDAGELQDADGAPMFTDEGTLAIPPTFDEVASG